MAVLFCARLLPGYVVVYAASEFLSYAVVMREVRPVRLNLPLGSIRKGHKRVVKQKNAFIRSLLAVGVYPRRHLRISASLGKLVPAHIAQRGETLRVARYAVAGITAARVAIKVVDNRHRHLRRRGVVAVRSVRVIGAKVPGPGLVQIHGDVLVGTRVGHEFACFNQRTRIVGGRAIDDVPRVS